MRKTQKKIARAAALKLAKRYIALCAGSGIAISRAILFGSQGAGAAKEHSDIDLLLVSDQFKNNTLENWKLIAPITACLYDVEPHPYPPAKFKKGDPFIEEVKRLGIEIKIR